MKKILLVFLLSPIIVIAQKKSITLEDLFKKGTFRSAFFSPAFKVESSKQTQAKYVLIEKEKEPIYRRSSKYLSYLLPAKTNDTILIDAHKVLHAEISPDQKYVSFVKENNLYLYDIATHKAIAITKDGKRNEIINGNCDWVYEEEFEFSKAYQWSPNGEYVAYYKFDESKVKEFTFTEYNNQYNHQYTYKYPKAGEDNSKVSIYLYHTKTGTTTKTNFEEGDIYIPRIKWATNNQLVVFWMNRHQNHLKLLLVDANTGLSKTIYEEKNKYYVEINDDLQFINNGAAFIYTSEQSGYKNLYLQDLNGNKKKTLTNFRFDITDIIGIDEANQLIYYTVAAPTPMDRNIFVTNYAKGKTNELTNGAGSKRLVLSNDFSEGYLYTSTIFAPQEVFAVSVSRAKNNVKLINKGVVSDNAKLKTTLKDYDLGEAQFIRIPNKYGDTLHGVMIKPANFDPNKKYPVLFNNYGGPGSQTVINSFSAIPMWEQLLAQRGFIIVSVDNTGTGNRGEEFKKKTYLQLGKYEIEDQIEAAKWLSNLPYVDKTKIGHWGWSYGGFMSALAITKGADVFIAAISVAPVTNWRFYDNIYTERYMRTPAENPEGYDNNSPINFTDKIKGKYLIIHGTSDDNVHFQNATQMVTAMIKNNVAFESAYYPNKNHGISGFADNTTLHLWKKMLNWILQNLGNENTNNTAVY